MSDEVLYAFLAGSLDPGEAAEVTAWLAVEDTRMARLESLRPQVEALTITPPRWRVPPPGYGWPARLSGAATLGDAKARVGGWFRVSVEPLDDAAERDVYVLRREQDWVLVAPASPADRVSLAALPRDEDGHHRVDLRGIGPVGEQRWLLAFPLRTAVDVSVWPPLDWLRDAIRTNSVPVVSVTVDIEAD